LYVHLAMRADDEGFIGNPNRIIKMVGANDDDYKILLAKKFLLKFESGVVVIKHWRMHNTIRMDRFAPTTYRREKAQLYLKENRAYTLSTDGVSLATKRQPVGNRLATQVRLSKDNINTATLNPEDAEMIKAEIRAIAHRTSVDHPHLTPHYQPSLSRPEYHSG